MVFEVVDFLQKTNENKSTWGIIVVKSNSFVHFLEEIDDPKNLFEINWPLAQTNFIWLFLVRKPLFDFQQWNFIGYRIICIIGVFQESWNNQPDQNIDIQIPNKYVFGLDTKGRKTNHFDLWFKNITAGPTENFQIELGQTFVVGLILFLLLE